MNINERNRGTAIFMLDATRSKVWIHGVKPPETSMDAGPWPAEVVPR